MACIPPTLDGWVYIEPIHGPLGGPLYTWAQYTPTHTTEIRIPFFASISIENLLKGAPENPLPRAFTYASYKIKTSMICQPTSRHL